MEIELDMVLKVVEGHGVNGGIFLPIAGPKCEQDEPKCRAIGNSKGKDEAFQQKMACYQHNSYHFHH